MSTTAKPHDLIGVTINNYTIQKKLGEGGMGIVYRARHPDLGLEIAIKVMRPELADRKGFFAAFKREAQTIARLQNPNIVSVRNFGHHAETGITYLTMDLVDGPTLRALLRDSPFGLPLASAVEIMEQIARALNYAHNQTVLHLDLKPDNILLASLADHERMNGSDCPYRPVISDFGLARLRMAPGVSIHTTQRIGTPHYMSPEQCRGESLDEKSDIYSLGVMFYELLTGQRPFPVSTLAHAVYYHGSQKPDPPSNHLPSLPSLLDEIVLSMLEKKPPLRPESAGIVARQLSDLLPSLTPPPSGDIFQSQAGAVVTPAEVEQWSSDRAPVFINVMYENSPIDRYSMKENTVIAGRVAPAELLLDSEDRMISKRHCEIRRQDREMQVRDLYSTNKTFLNNEPLQPGVFTVWPLGVPLRLGLFTLTWGATSSASLPEIPSPEVPEPPIPRLQCSAAQPPVLQMSHKPTYIGRLPSCDMVIADPGISKRHCVVYWDGKHVQVKDLGSTNGSSLGGTRLEPEILHPWSSGIELNIGPYSIQLSESKG